MKIIHKKIASAVSMSIAAIFAFISAGLMDGGSPFDGWFVAAIALATSAFILWAVATRQERKEFDRRLNEAIKKLNKELAEYGAEQ